MVGNYIYLLEICWILRIVLMKKLPCLIQKYPVWKEQKSLRCNLTVFLSLWIQLQYKTPLKIWSKYIFRPSNPLFLIYPIFLSKSGIGPHLTIMGHSILFEQINEEKSPFDSKIFPICRSYSKKERS